MRYQDALVDQLLRGVPGMEESTTYQAIIRKGAAQGALQEARKLLLQLWQDRLGAAAAPEVQARVEMMQDLEQLEQLILRVTQARSWDELLPAPPKPQRRKSSRR
jgi:hypothetical protein